MRATSPRKRRPSDRAPLSSAPSDATRCTSCECADLHAPRRPERRAIRSRVNPLAPARFSRSCSCASCPRWPIHGAASDWPWPRGPLRAAPNARQRAGELLVSINDPIDISLAVFFLKKNRTSHKYLAHSLICFFYLSPFIL